MWNRNRLFPLALAAWLAAGCDSSRDHATEGPNGDSVTAPCAVFTEEGKTPLDPETQAPLYDVDTLTGIHEAACRFKPFGDRHVGIQVLTRSGWAILVGSAPEAECLAAIEAMIPHLPR